MSTEQIDTEGLTPAQQAAQEALQRADQPPAAAQPDEGPARPSRHFAQAANAERPDVFAAEDQYADARAAVANEPHTLEDDADEWAEVTEWLLADTAEVITRKLTLRVGGGDDNPRLMPWIIRAVGIDVIRAAEREASGANRAQRRSGESGYDELKANLRVIVEGTVKPDLKAIARQRGIADPAILVQQRFAYRPGLIAQIAGEVMSVSGFDADDVRAAGN